MSVKHAAAKKKVLTEIMQLMTKVGGSRLAPSASPEHDDGEVSEPEETDVAPADHEPKKPSFSWAEGDQHDGEPSGDEEDAPSSEELDAMEAKLRKHGRR